MDATKHVARPLGERRALRMALAVIELHTGNGCQNPRALPKDADGNVDYEGAVRMIRDTLNVRPPYDCGTTGHPHGCSCHRDGGRGL